MRQDRKKTDDRPAAGGLFRFCDARAVCWWMVIPVAIIVVLLVRARTSRWGLGTSSARALRFDRTVKVFNKTVEPPDTDPAFDPEGDAAKIKADTAAKAEARLKQAAAKVQRTEGSKKSKAAVAAGEKLGTTTQKTKGAGTPGSDANAQQAADDQPDGEGDSPGSQSEQAPADQQEAGKQQEPAVADAQAEAQNSEQQQQQQQQQEQQDAPAAGKQGKQGVPVAEEFTEEDTALPAPAKRKASAKRPKQDGAADKPSEKHLSQGGFDALAADGADRVAKGDGGDNGDSGSSDGSGSNGSNAAGSDEHGTNGSGQTDGGKSVGDGSGRDGMDGSGGSGGDNSGGDSAGSGSGGDQPAALPTDHEERTKATMMSFKPEAKQRPARKRKTDVKFVVVPAHKCQLLDDPLANACMYGGLEGAQTPDCREATEGQTSNSYMPAFTRIAPYIAQYGARKYSVAPIWDGSTEEAKGEWQAKINGAEVLIIDELALVYLGSKIEGKKVIVLQHDAAASMRTCATGVCASSILKQDRLLGYLQHTSLVPLTRNNARRVKDMVHFELLDLMHKQGKPAEDYSMEPLSEEAPFSQKMLSKVYTIVPMLWRWRFPITCKGRPEFVEWMMKALQGGAGDFPPFLRPLHERSVDLAFYGRLTPPKAWKGGEELPDELFKLHRQQLFDSVSKLERDAPEVRVVLSEPVDYETFAEGLRDAKLFVSPLGKAEASGKDYEAVISRAVLIKPLASMLKSYPNIYEVGVTCVEVKSDYSDLEAVVKELLGDPDRMQRIADTAYQRLLSHSSERPVAQDIAETLMDIVEADNSDSTVYLD